MPKTRVLFFAEAVTLAHVARPIALAKMLDAARFEVTVACHSRYRAFFEAEGLQRVELASIASGQFLAQLAKGKPVYDRATLSRYVEDDLELLRRLRPDLVVGDFRLSLSVSARLSDVPYATVTNAYWSPFCARRTMPMPALPMTRLIPIPMAATLFKIAAPFAFRFHCKPLNQVRAAHGLPSLGDDLRSVYTDADKVLYADAPGLFPTTELPSNHRFIGPVMWSPPVPPPPWWGDLSLTKPIIYVTLGSSGQARTLERVLQALADMPVQVIVSTAGLALRSPAPPNAFVADYLPGFEAAARSRLVICNGGSPTSQQAIAAGVPVLGIASNMDQFLNLERLVDGGAAILLRADRATPATIRKAVMRALHSEALIEAAGHLRSASETARAGKTFAAVVSETAHVENKILVATVANHERSA